MNLPVIRDLAGQYSKAELDAAAAAFETGRENPYGVSGKDDAEILTNLLIASAVRGRMEQKELSPQDAVREQSQSVRKILTGLKKNS